MENISAINVKEITLEDYKNVNGGGIIPLTVSVTAYVYCLNQCHELGENVGKALYRATH